MNKELLNRTIRWAVLISCLWNSASLHADTFIWGGTGGVYHGGYAISPYTATNTAPNPDEKLLLYCLDFNHRASTTTWEATVRPLDPENVGAYQYRTDSPTPAFDVTSSALETVYDRYLAAAWMFSQVLGSTDARSLAVHQYAAWMLFLDVNHAYVFNYALGRAGDAFAADVRAKFQEAFDFDPATEDYRYRSVDSSKWRVVTPIRAGYPDSVQEFLTPVPEPSGRLLLLVGAAAVLGFLSQIQPRAR